MENITLREEIKASLVLVKELSQALNVSNQERQNSLEREILAHDQIIKFQERLLLSTELNQQLAEEIISLKHENDILKKKLDEQGHISSNMPNISNNQNQG